MSDRLRIIGVETGDADGDRFSVVGVPGSRPVAYFCEGDLRTALIAAGMSETMINKKIDSARRHLRSNPLYDALPSGMKVDLTLVAAAFAADEANDIAVAAECPSGLLPRR